MTSGLRRAGLAVALLAVVVVAGAPAGAQSEFTPDWLFTEAGKSVTRVPARAWLADGSALVFDRRPPEGERTFERVDPATGSRSPALDMKAAIASWSALGVDAGIGRELPWPDALAPSGRTGIYLLAGDLFLLDLPSAKFSRLTATPAEEKSPGLSPDGNRLAFVRDNDLYTLDLATRTEHRVTTDGSDTILNGTLSWVYWEEVFARRDIGYWWAPDSTAIAWLRTDESPVAEMYFPDFAPAVPRVIRQRYPKAGTDNPTVRVGVAAADGSAPAWVKIDDRPFEYIVRVNWLPDGRRLAVQTLTRDQRELALYFVERSTGSASLVLTETDPGWVNVHDDLYFFADGRHFLWSSERDGYRHLYRYGMDGRVVNRVTSGEWTLASSSGGVSWLRQAIVGVDEPNDWIYFMALEASSIERHLYRIHADGTGMGRLTRDPGVHGIDLSPDTRYYLDRFSDIGTPPALRLHAVDGRMIAEMAAPRTDLLQPFALPSWELVRVPADDGFEMPGQLLKPRGFDPAKTYPVVLYVYGGPSSPTVSNGWQSYHLFHQLLAKDGYVVAQVDNRAATAVSKKLENTILDRSGEPETADLLAAVRWLKSQPWVDGARVGVWGWSGGGTMTLNLMTRSTEFAAGISVAPVTDWHYYDTRWTEAFMKRPSDNPEGYERTSLVARAGRLHGRLLLVHGTYDDNVHLQNSEAFIDALVAEGILFDSMIYPMRKHDIGDDAAKRHLFRTMLEFWKRAL